MRALIKVKREYGGLEVRQVDTPKISDDEVLIQVEACGVCGSDLHVYEYLPGYEFLQLPLVLGHEICGLVVETGSQVKGISAGDRVLSEAGFGCGMCLECREGNYDLCANLKAYGIHLHGGMAEYVKVKERGLHKLDERITSLEGSAIEPTAISVRAVLERSKIKPGDLVVVFGVGIIGFTVAQASRLKGADPILLIGGEADQNVRLPKAGEMGFHVLTDSENLVKRISEIFHGQRPTTIFECSGSTEAFKKAIELVCRGGRIVLVGIYGRPVEISCTSIVRNQIFLIPSYAYRWQTFEKAIDLVAAGKISLKPLVTPYPLENGEQAFQDSLNKKIVKAVIQP